MDFTQEEILRAYERYFLKRADMGKSDSDVSRGSGVYRGTFSAWKKGKTMPDVKSLYKIATFCNCKVSEILAD